MSKCKSVVCVPHKDGRIRACNPVTGLCKLVPSLKTLDSSNKGACGRQKCTAAQVCNPATSRCVKRDGVVGKRVLAEAGGSFVKPKPTPKKQVTSPRSVHFAADTKNFNGTFFSPGESSKSLMRPLRMPRRS